MRKLAAVLLSATILLLAVPLKVSAVSSDTEVINQHGAKTYIGTYSDWSKKSWNSDNFTEVTGDDIDCSGTLIIQSGKLGNVTVRDNSDLTIYNGTMTDVDVDGSISMSGGTVNTLSSNEDINLSGGTVKGDVEAHDGVTLSGKSTIGGSVTGNDVTVYALSNIASVTVSNDVSFSNVMILEGSYYKFGNIDGQSSGKLEFENFTGTIPAFSNVQKLSVDTYSSVTAASALDLDTLTIGENAQFVTTAALTVGTIEGPGTLISNVENLTVNFGVFGNPVFDFNGSEKDGIAVFKAKSETVSAGDITIYGYGLNKETGTDGYDTFALQALTGDGVTLDPSFAKVGSGKYITVKATVAPSLSGLADGSKLYWKLINPSSNFSVTPDINSNTCRVNLSSSAGATACKATLGAYLADINGNVLSEYKSASCLIVSANTADSGISLDTTSVSIPLGRTYFVLAVTDSQTPPAAVSYNSAVARVGKAVAYHSSSKDGWLYPVTAVARGGVTIDIGGQKMFVSV
jgi:hypothetical protein